MSDRKTAGTTAGTFYTLSAFILWGILPGYWRELKSVPATEIIYHRIVWSFLVSMLLLFITGRTQSLIEIFRNRRHRFFIYLTSAAIVLNWFIYVYAINSGRIVETSLGYYINPLVTIFLGMAFLKERLNLLQISALLLAVCGVLYASFSFGRVPWIAVTLAFSFALYGFFKKLGNLDSVTSLTAETMLLSIIALPALISIASEGSGAFIRGSLYTDILLAGSGIISAVPLYLFASGAKAIPLSRAGFLQHISPTLTLAIGVLQYGEDFTRVHTVSFSFIWAALILYTFSGLRENG